MFAFTSPGFLLFTVSRSLTESQKVLIFGAPLFGVLRFLEYISRRVSGVESVYHWSSTEKDIGKRLLYTRYLMKTCISGRHSVLSSHLQGVMLSN